MFQGSCLCRGVRYELSAEPGAFGYCHCTSCRKARAQPTPPMHRSVEQPFICYLKELIREFESSSGKFRAFCTNCGSPLYGYLSATPEIIRIRLGTPDTPFFKQATCAAKRER
jgi:hypothetical protein